jgi:hypothetical protein
MGIEVWRNGMGDTDRCTSERLMAYIKKLLVDAMFVVSSIEITDEKSREIVVKGSFIGDVIKE